MILELDEESLARLRSTNRPMARKRRKGSRRPLRGLRVLPVVDPAFEPRRLQGAAVAVAPRPTTEDQWY